MIKELIEGKNIGNLPDPFPFLTNNKILKVKSSKDISSEYLDLYLEMEKTFISFKEIKTNDVVKGTIVAITQKEIFVNFGYKDYIYVDKPKKSNVSTELKVGDEIDVLITEISDNPYIIKGSITELIKQNVHNKMKRAQEVGIHAQLVHFPKEITQVKLLEEIKSNDSPKDNK